MSSALLLIMLIATGGADAGVPRPIEPGDVDEPADDPAIADGGTPASTDAGPSAAITFALQARVEPQPVPFGEEVRLVVDFVRPARTAIKVPDDLGAKEALPRTTAPPQRAASPLADGRVKEVITFPFLALDMKDLATPSFTITIGEDQLLEVPSLPVRVAVSELPDPTDGGTPDGALALEPAAGTILYRVDDPRPFALLALFVIVIVAIVLVRAAIGARSLTVPVVAGPPPPPPRPAHEVALERLDALMPMLSQGEVSTFVERVMDEVLRDYLAGRFALAAGTRTTKEIVTDVLSVPAVGLDVALIEAVGRDADLVKFARGRLAADQAHAMAGRVRALIVATAAVSTVGGTSSPGGAP